MALYCPSFVVTVTTAEPSPIAVTKPEELTVTFDDEQEKVTVLLVALLGYTVA